jgi:hypothetical protein
VDDLSRSDRPPLRSGFLLSGRARFDACLHT